MRNIEVKLSEIMGADKLQADTIRRILVYKDIEMPVKISLEEVRQIDTISDYEKALLIAAMIPFMNEAEIINIIRDRAWCEICACAAIRTKSESVISIIYYSGFGFSNKKVAIDIAEYTRNGDILFDLCKNTIFEDVIIAVLNNPSCDEDFLILLFKEISNIYLAHLLFSRILYRLFSNEKNIEENVSKVIENFSGNEDGYIIHNIYLKVRNRFPQLFDKMKNHKHKRVRDFVNASEFWNKQ